MKTLTKSELETLNILFEQVDYGKDTIFDKAFYYLYKALRKYYELERSDE